MTDAALRLDRAETTTYAILLSISLCHLLNDVMQSLLAAIYPMLKDEFTLDFWQIGLLTFCFQVTASLLQPLVGIVTDRKPLPYSLPVGMASTMCGLLLLSSAARAWKPSAARWPSARRVPMPNSSRPLSIVPLPSRSITSRAPAPP